MDGNSGKDPKAGSSPRNESVNSSKGLHTCHSDPLRDTTSDPVSDRCDVGSVDASILATESPSQDSLFKEESSQDSVSLQVSTLSHPPFADSSSSSRVESTPPDQLNVNSYLHPSLESDNAKAASTCPKPAAYESSQSVARGVNNSACVKSTTKDNDGGTVSNDTDEVVQTDVHTFDQEGSVNDLPHVPAPVLSDQSSSNSSTLSLNTSLKGHSQKTVTPSDVQPVKHGYDAENRKTDDVSLNSQNSAAENRPERDSMTTASAETNDKTGSGPTFSTNPDFSLKDDPEELTPATGEKSDDQSGSNGQGASDKESEKKGFISQTTNSDKSPLRQESQAVAVIAELEQDRRADEQLEGQAVSLDSCHVYLESEKQEDMGCGRSKGAEDAGQQQTPSESEHLAKKDSRETENMPSKRKNNGRNRAAPYLLQNRSVDDHENRSDRGVRNRSSTPPASVHRSRQGLSQNLVSVQREQCVSDFPGGLKIQLRMIISCCGETKPLTCTFPEEIEVRKWKLLSKLDKVQQRMKSMKMGESYSDGKDTVFLLGQINLPKEAASKQVDQMIDMMFRLYQTIISRTFECDSRHIMEQLKKSLPEQIFSEVVCVPSADNKKLMVLAVREQVMNQVKESLLVHLGQHHSPEMGEDKESFSAKAQSNSCLETVQDRVSENSVSYETFEQRHGIKNNDTQLHGELGTSKLSTHRNPQRELQSSAQPSYEKQPLEHAGSVETEVVQISQLEADLFQVEEVRATFLEEILRRNLWVSPDKLNAGTVVVKRGCRRDVLGVIRSLVHYVESIPLTNCHEVDGILTELKQMKPGFLFLKQTRTTLNIAFHDSIRSSVEKCIFSLKNATFRFPLPRYMRSYFKLHLEALMTSSLRDLPSSAIIDIEEQQQFKGLTLRVDRKEADRASEKVTLALAKLVLRRKPVDLATALYLEDPEGQKHIKSIEERYRCAVRVDQPENPVSKLLEAKSPEGHQLLVYEGDTTGDCGCDMIVLPFCGQWSQMQQEILHRGFLPLDVGDYSARIGPSPKADSLMLQCQGESLKCKVVIMHIPGVIDDKSLHHVQETFENTMKKAAASGTSIAIVLSKNLNPEVNLKAILPSINECLGSDCPPTPVQLFLEKNTADITVKFCAAVETHLKGWDLCDFSESSGRRRTIRTAVGEILDFSADVVVSSSSVTLELGKGKVSAVLSKAAGPKLAQQCEQLYREGLKHDIVAITDCFNMEQFKKIFHIALSTWDYKKLPMPILEWLHTRVQSCLALASAMNFKSIVFPTLGTGNLEYPPEQAARTMFAACREFFIEMPHSSVNDITIVCYFKDSKVYQDFKVEETRFAFQEHAVIVRDEVQEVKDSRVLVIEGDAEKHHATADFTLISRGSSLELADINKQTWRLAPGGSKESMKQVLTMIAEKSNSMVSLQINLDSFGSDCYSEIASALEKYLPDAKAVKVVILVVQDFNHLRNFCDALCSASKKSSGFWQKLPFGQGGKTSAPQVPAEREKEVTPSCHLSISGTMASVQDALDKLNFEQLQVPANLKERASKQMAARTRNKQEPGEEPQGTYRKGALADLAEAIRQDDEISDTCCLVLPSTLRDLNQEEYSQLCSIRGLKNFRPEQPSLQFEFDFESLPLVSTEVYNKIRSFQGGRGSTSNSAVTLPTPWKKDIDVLEYEALEYLLGQKFTNQFNTDMKANGTMTITSKTERPPPDMINKMEILRREDLQLPPGSDGHFCAKEEGIEAYIKVLPEQGKVAVFGFEYNTMTKAKHLVSVKTGKIRTTTRSRRKFEDSGGDENSPESSMQSQRPLYPAIVEKAGQEPCELKTPSGIKVSVYKTDITKLPVDAIVNAANEHLAHGGGVAYAIAKAAGFELEDEGEDYIRRHGPIEVTGVVATTGGSLPCKKVLHAVGPRWTDYKDKAQCCRDLTETVLNCLRDATKRGFTSVAVTSISSAIFGVPQQTCAQCYLSAVKRFDEQSGHLTSLTHIHFVDVNDSMVSLIQNTFRALWSKSVSDLSSPQHSAAADDGEEPSRRRRRLRQAPGIPGPELSGAGQDPMSTENMEIYPELGVTKFNLHGLGVHFRTGNILDYTTDALVLWQDQNNIFADKLSEKFLTRNSAFANDFVPKFKMQYAKHGGKVITEMVKGTVLVLPIVSHNSSTLQQEIHAGLMQALIRVNEAKGRSIAIPRYPYTSRVSNHDLDTFSKAAYYAVANFSKLENTTLTDIHFFDPEGKTSSQLVDCFSIEFTKEVSVKTDTQPNKLESSDKSNTAAAASEDRCSICLGDFRKPKSLHLCGHTFCTECIDESFKKSNLQKRCPLCKKVYGQINGDQPDGKMKFFLSRSTTLSGYHPGAYIIEYDFPRGKQKDCHPNPGRTYQVTRRTAYLPDTREGRMVLMLLKVAFDRRLIFTVGQSVSSGLEDQITWNDIHHKTRTSGGYSSYGYPDPTYFKRVQDDLAEKGVTDQDLSPKQKKFVEDPRSVSVPALYTNFSHLI